MILFKTQSLKEKRNILYYIFLLLCIIFLAFFPQFVSGYSPFTIDPAGLTAPSFMHLLGTDFLGRDVLSRSLAGARASLLIGVGARLISVIFGTVFGLIIGSLPDLYQKVAQKIVETFLAIPSLLLAMVLVVILGEGYLTIMIAITVGTWAPVAKFTAVQVIEIQKRDYVIAARALGARKHYITGKYVLPALLPLLLPLATTGIATSIMMEATLSFLGLGGGTGAHTLPSWGSMINEGVKFLFDAPWLLIPSSLLLMVLILIFNRIGDIIATILTTRES